VGFARQAGPSVQGGVSRASVAPTCSPGMEPGPGARVVSVAANARMEVRAWRGALVAPVGPFGGHAGVWSRAWGAEVVQDARRCHTCEARNASIDPRGLDPQPALVGNCGRRVFGMSLAFVRAKEDGGLDERNHAPRDRRCRRRSDLRLRPCERPGAAFFHAVPPPLMHPPPSLNGTPPHRPKQYPTSRSDQPASHRGPRTRFFRRSTGAVRPLRRAAPVRVSRRCAIFPAPP